MLDPWCQPFHFANKTDRTQHHNNQDMGPPVNGLMSRRNLALALTIILYFYVYCNAAILCTVCYLDKYLTALFQHSNGSIPTVAKLSSISRMG